MLWWNEWRKKGAGGNIELETIRINMKRSIFWDTTPCSSLKLTWRFGGIFRLHLQDRRNKLRRKQAWNQAENSALIHRVMSQTTEPFLTTAVRTSNPTQDEFILGVGLLYDAVSVEAISVEWQEYWWMMNFKGFWRKRSQPFRCKLQEFAWKWLRKTTKISVKIAAVSAEVWIQHLQNTSPENYR
jgi:hypothetical protein